jgi:hypothetical protein
MAIESATGRVWAGNNAQTVYCWSPNLDVELLAWVFQYDVWSIAVADGRVYIGDARGTITSRMPTLLEFPLFLGRLTGATSVRSLCLPLAPTSLRGAAQMKAFVCLTLPEAHNFTC